MSDFDNKYNIVDEKLPRHSLMVGRYKQSFAYYTLRERLPTILTHVIDNLSKDKELIAEKYSESVRDELKDIIGKLSKLKYELQTDKQMHELQSNDGDTEIWNDFIKTLPNDCNTYFSACWLYAECYMYRKIKECFEGSSLLKDYDYFKKQKEEALTCCTESLELVVIKTRKIPEDETVQEFLQKLLKLNLWGNRCDLSISNGKEIKQTGDQLSMLDELDSFILIEHIEQIWNCVCKPHNGERIIDIVNDNSGYELFTDLILAEFLIDQKLATKIRFNLKAIPWYISDVTSNDFKWTIEYLSSHESKILSEVGQKWSNFINDGKFVVNEASYFWTTPYEFYRMKEVSSQLYEKLSEAHLVIFKGDLNYRKLIGDYTWDYTESFDTCLRDFHPSNLCTLRTIKADLICGLKEGIAEKLDKTDPTWMVTGKYGLIQFSRKVN